MTRNQLARYSLVLHHPRSAPPVMSQLLRQSHCFSTIKIIRRPKMIRKIAGAMIMLSMVAVPGAVSAASNTVFQMTVSPGGQTCLPNATGRVTITPADTVEHMHLEIAGLPANTDFDFFVLQVPNAPFGLAWYQGDISTDKNGRGGGNFVGRFSSETFIVAPGVAVAPVVFKGKFPDANTNPTTAPVQLYHLGVWFNKPKDAAAAGCPNTETPFNGEHNAGIQILNTASFPDRNGPLRQVDQ